MQKEKQILKAQVYLNVPYEQKDEAKALGARWDKEVKKWYFDGAIKDIAKFGKWILPQERDSIIIAYENICLIEGKRKCYKCGKETRVVGFGIWEHSILQEDNGKYFIEDPDDYPEQEDEIHLAWTDDESKIPPLILKYITEHYNVKSGYSKIAGKSFANHCDHCGSIQGNYYLFQEDSPISTLTPVEKELIDRMSGLKIYNIYTDSALILDWDIGYCSNDWAYTQYCKGAFQDIILSEIDEELFTSYAEMYRMV